MIEFPVGFPTDALQVLYAAWQAKDYKTPGLGKAIWNLTGYILSMGGLALTRSFAGPPPNEEAIDNAFKKLLSGAIDADAIKIVNCVCEDAKDAT